MFIVSQSVFYVSITDIINTVRTFVPWHYVRDSHYTLATVSEYAWIVFIGVNAAGVWTPIFDLHWSVSVLDPSNNYAVMLTMHYFRQHNWCVAVPLSYVC